MLNYSTLCNGGFCLLDVPFVEIMLKVMLVVLLVLLNGFFVASEFALVKVRSTRIAQLSEEGNSKAKKVQGILNNLNTYLSATQLGITLSSLGLGWMGEPLIGSLLEPLLAKINISHTVGEVISFTVAFSIITILHIVLGEMAPKTIAIGRAENTVLWIGRPLRWFFIIFRPAIWLLNSMSNILLRLLKIKVEPNQQQAHTEEEIRMLVAHSHKSGIIDQTELSLLDNIFDFSGRIGREIMVPRISMICIYTNYSFEQNLAIIKQSHFTRFPLCGRDKDDILGVVHIRDLYERMTLDDNPSKARLNFKEIARPTVMLPETMEIQEILRTLQKHRTELAIVIDEYGGTSGIITIEDIIEEIVGEIQDEFDDEIPDFQQSENNETSIDAQLLIEEVNEHFNLDIHDEDNHTIGGWVFSNLRKIPKIGASIDYKEYRFTVQEMNQRKISRLLVKPLANLK